MMSICLWMCECVFVSKTEDAKLNTEDTQLKFHLLSKDENSGNHGRTHYHT